MTSKTKQRGDAALKTWSAYRIKGSSSEKHPGLIHAETQLEAEKEAWIIFKADTEAERRRVYVRETP